MLDSSWLASTTLLDLQSPPQETQQNEKIEEAIRSFTLTLYLCSFKFMLQVGLPFINGNDPNLKFLLMIPSGLVGLGETW